MHRVINEYKRREEIKFKQLSRNLEKEDLKPNSFNELQDIHLTLAQNNPREIDILRLLTSSAFGKFKAIYDELDEKKS